MESTARLRKGVLVGLGAVALLFLALGVLPIGDYLKGLFLNLGTELVGAAATYYVLDLLIGSRAEGEGKKAALIAQLGSRVHDVAVAAAEELRQYGWLYDGSLREANLPFANLEGANLSHAGITMFPYNQHIKHVVASFLVNENGGFDSLSPPSVCLDDHHPTCCCSPLTIIRSQFASLRKLWYNSSRSQS